MSASASRSCDGARGRDRRRGKIQKTKGGRTSSRTHVGAVADFGGGLGGDLSLGGDGTGHALDLRSGDVGRGIFQSARCSGPGSRLPGLRCWAREERRGRPHSPRPSARHGGTRRPCRAQPGESLGMERIRQVRVSQSVDGSLKSAVASGRNAVTPTVRSAAIGEEYRKEIGNARRITHQTWRGRRRTRKWAPERAWRQPACCLDRRGYARCASRSGAGLLGAVPIPFFLKRKTRNG